MADHVYKCICGKSYPKGAMSAHTQVCQQFREWKQKIIADPETPILIRQLGFVGAGAKLGVNDNTLNNWFDGDGNVKEQARKGRTRQSSNRRQCADCGEYFRNRQRLFDHREKYHPKVNEKKLAGPATDISGIDGLLHQANIAFERLKVAEGKIKELNATIISYATKIVTLQNELAADRTRNH